MHIKHQLVSQSTIIFQSSSRQARLRQTVASTVEASFSTVLTMTSYLLRHYPQMLPPRTESIMGDGSYVGNEDC